MEMTSRTRVRCAWASDDPLMQAYHDEEWGVPAARPPRALGEADAGGFQAGLAWITVLRKREAFRKAFAGFDPDTVARFGEADVDRLMANPGIIRSRAKIEATIARRPHLLRDARSRRGFRRLLLVLHRRRTS